jgi:hypothetical protein
MEEESQRKRKRYEVKESGIKMKDKKKAGNRRKKEKIWRRR